MNQKEFYETVYEIVEKIPSGRVMTYGMIAKLIGEPRHARQVAKALSVAPMDRNLPCHRVVNQKGEMAPDYVFGHRNLQRAMLEKEGVRFKENGCVDMKKTDISTEGCTICPRECRALRSLDQKGVCHESSQLHVARAALHFWEEPFLSGERGSGTVFFSGCNLACVYCQNQEISRGIKGKYITNERLADIFLELQEKGAHNINLVTPTHFTNNIIMAIRESRKIGLQLPIVYNTSAYDSVDMLRKLEGSVDIYLPDFKYIDAELGQRYSKVKDYPSIAKAAIAEMVRQQPICCFEDESKQEESMLTKGVVVRHLVLPGQVEHSKKVIDYLYHTYGNSIFLSIMNQYTPMSVAKDYPELQRKVSEEEYEEIVEYAIDIGVENALIQEGDTASESFIPDFDDQGV